MTKLTTRSLAAAALLLASVPSAQAASWAQIGDTAELAKTSAAGFKGTVVERSYREVDIDGNPFPYTETTFHISDCLFGCPTNNEIIIRQIGGHYSSRKDLAMLVPGLAHYEIGQDYFVFAGGAKDDLFGSRFGEHGSLPLVKLDRDGESVVVNYSGALLQLADDGKSIGKSGLRCQSLNADSVCSDVSGDAKPSASADGISAHAFARFVREIASAKSEPKRELLDRHQFETALAAYAGSRK